jgi:hypothetical protein
VWYTGVWNVVVDEGGTEGGDVKVKSFFAFVDAFFCRRSVFLAVTGEPCHCTVAPECFADAGGGVCTAALLEFGPYRLVEASLEEVDVANV